MPYHKALKGIGQKGSNSLWQQKIGVSVKYGSMLPITSKYIWKLEAWQFVTDGKPCAGYSKSKHVWKNLSDWLVIRQTLTDTPHIPMKRLSSKPSPRKNGSSNTQTTTSQTASTNWTGQSRLFSSGWELDTTDLTPTCTTNSRLASLRCAHATQTSWLQNIYCSTVHYMMLWGGTHGRNRHLWGTSCMATWRSWRGQPPSWQGNSHLHLAYDEEEEDGQTLWPLAGQFSWCICLNLMT